LPWDAAVDVRASFHEFDDGVGDEVARLDDAVDEAWEPLGQAGVDLVNTAPTTLAGIVTAIQYLRAQMEDDGTYMPQTLVLDAGGDAQTTMGWIDAWLDTIADAAVDLDRAGKAVQS
jgi:hypothetical protein